MSAFVMFDMMWDGVISSKKTALCYRGKQPLQCHLTARTLRLLETGQGADQGASCSPLRTGCGRTHQKQIAPIYV